MFFKVMTCFKLYKQFLFSLCTLFLCHLTSCLSILNWHSKYCEKWHPSPLIYRCCWKDEVAYFFFLHTPVIGVSTACLWDHLISSTRRCDITASDGVTIHSLSTLSAKSDTRKLSNQPPVTGATDRHTAVPQAEMVWEDREAARLLKPVRLRAALSVIFDQRIFRPVGCRLPLSCRDVI